jgi:hypothetical protein
MKSKHGIFQMLIATLQSEVSDIQIVAIARRLAPASHGARNAACLNSNDSESEPPYH